MTQKTADLGHDVSSATLTEEDAKDFFERLDEFRKGLSEKEQAILAVMVVEAAGDDIPTPEAEGEGQVSPPTDEEVHAFLEKLNRFHDELPGEQPLYVDQILAKTWFKDQSEVQGYHWRQIGGWLWIPNQHRDEFIAACRSVGGDAVQFRRRRPGGGHVYAGCFDNMHY
jgi:hypothetical protein